MNWPVIGAWSSGVVRGKGFGGLSMCLCTSVLARRQDAQWILSLRYVDGYALPFRSDFVRQLRYELADNQEPWPKLTLEQIWWRAHARYIYT